MAEGASRCDRVKELARVTRRGLYPPRSPEIIPIPKEPNFLGGELTLVHSGPWDYLTHVPFVLYGPGFIEATGAIARPATIADAAPTTARLIGFGGFDAPDGKVLTEALVGDRVPRLVVQVVWDGGGWNALEKHRGKWPYLEKLMRKGASYTRFSVGSSPSVTPAIHTSLGTGAFPSSHGVVGLRMRTPDGAYVNPLGGVRPGNIEVPTLADVYDERKSNEPLTGMLGSVSWHIGMIGQGAAREGGDRDPMALMSHVDASVRTNQSLYSLPAIGDASTLEMMIDDVDGRDGSKDLEWMGRPLSPLKDAWRTPALVDYTEYLLERMIVEEGFGRDRIADLLYVNFKSADLAGHAWSFNSDEVGKIIRAKDAALKRLIRFLDRKVGEQRWVVLLTADHGMTPYPKDSGALPIRGRELAADLKRRFDTDGDEIQLVDRVGAAGINIERSQLAGNDVTLDRIARWVADYRAGENLQDGQKLPAYYRGDEQDRIFDAVMVNRRLVVPDCSGS